MKRFLSVFQVVTDAGSRGIKWFYRCFDYSGTENAFRDLMAFSSLVLFQSILIFSCWSLSGWIILRRLGQ